MSRVSDDDSFEKGKNNGARLKRMMNKSNEKAWDSALNFLKFQNEKTVKMRDEWKKEKQSLQVKNSPS